MVKALRLIVSSMIVALALPGLDAVHADQVVIGASKDNTLYQYVASDGDLSNGVGTYIFVGRTDNALVRRAVLGFDIAASGIPAGSTITAVSLRLNMSRTRDQQNPRNHGLHRLLASWGEGTSDATNQEGAGAPATTNDATWRHRFYSATLWSTAGGSYNATASATTSVAGTGPYTWSGAGLVADVQAWLNTPANNFGWILIGNETINKTARRFDSRENGTVANRPQLTITYTPPAGTGACCLGGGVCEVLTSTQCTTQGGTYQGNGTSCNPNPCAQPTGGCCFSDGSCSVVTSTVCGGSGGTWQGSGTSCTPNTCPQPTGACCVAAGTCSEVTSAQCTAISGEYQGVGTTCALTECPVVLTPFVDALPIPGVFQPVSGVPGGEAFYQVAITEFDQKLHRDLPLTRVWGYAGGTPGPVIEATSGQTVTVEWINDLRDAQGNLRGEHYLPVDLCMHGPDHEGATPRTVVHLHGAHVAAEYDGYPHDTILPGQSQTFIYPNNQLPATLWFHDHALGITRLNVMMGLAGLYLLRDATEQALGLPSGPYEVPLVIQDRKFNADGTLNYPAEWHEHFFGDKVMVNGKVWPYLNVNRGKYRFRIVSGSNSRHYRLAMSNNAAFQQIGTDGGLLPAPVSLTSLTLGPGERADIVIDFAAYPAGTELLLVNSAPAPFPGTPGEGVIPNVVKFIVQSASGHTAPLPAVLRPIEVLQESQATQHREFVLRKMSDPCAGSMWTINGLLWDDITEYPELGETEVWSFVNRSGISHPMHMHLVMFQILDRQAFQIINDEVVPIGAPVPPPPNEAGWKDTVLVGPSEIARVIARFETYKGRFPYHCHILEHEDHEMMRQFETVQCGDLEMDATEACDDGNLVAGDACSAGCDFEYFLHFAGLATGGTIQVTVGGEVVIVNTTAGMTPSQVAQAIADAINATSGLGATAIVQGDRVIIDAVTTLNAVGDGGLQGLLTLRLGKDRLWWSSQVGTAVYDVVRGDLATLRLTAGDFAQATNTCVGNDRAVPQYVDSYVPMDGVWYLVRPAILGGGGGTYNTGLPGQIGTRDPGIAASGSACP